MTDTDKLKSILFRQTEEVTRQLRGKKKFARTVAVIYKNKDFKNYSAQAKLQNESNNMKDIYKLVVEIFEKSYKKDPIRLIGIRLADLKSSKDLQLTLFDEEKKKLRKNQKFKKQLIT